MEIFSSKNLGIIYFSFLLSSYLEFGSTRRGCFILDMKYEITYNAFCTIEITTN